MKETGDDLKKLLGQNPLYVFAMQEEAGALFGDVPALFTGVGKVNAAYALGKAVTRHRPGIIVNLGSAGSTVFGKDSVVCCRKFVQRDMDATALGFERYQTPFSSLPRMLEHGFGPPGLPQGICGTGDHFETAHQEPLYDVLDMEAYSLALIAVQEGIPFLCLKYITDGADGSARQDWHEALATASGKLGAAMAALRNA